MKNEYLIYGGDDITKTLKHIFNELMRKGTVPKRWKQMKIKSIYKNRGERTKMKNQRGIFLTNIVSKVFERVLLNRNREKIDEATSEFQCGGRKGRSTISLICSPQETLFLEVC